MTVSHRWLDPGASTASSSPMQRSRTGSRPGGKKAARRIDADYLDWALADFSGSLAAAEHSLTDRSASCRFLTHNASIVTGTDHRQRSTAITPGQRQSREIWLNRCRLASEWSTRADIGYRRRTDGPATSGGGSIRRRPPRQPSGPRASSGRTAIRGGPPHGASLGASPVRRPMPTATTRAASASPRPCAHLPSRAGGRVAAPSPC